MPTPFPTIINKEASFHLYLIIITTYLHQHSLPAAFVPFVHYHHHLPFHAFSCPLEVQLITNINSLLPHDFSSRKQPHLLFGSACHQLFFFMKPSVIAPLNMTADTFYCNCQLPLFFSAWSCIISFRFMLCFEHFICCICFIFFSVCTSSCLVHFQLLPSLPTINFGLLAALSEITHQRLLPSSLLLLLCLLSFVASTISSYCSSWRQRHQRTSSLACPFLCKQQHHLYRSTSSTILILAAAIVHHQYHQLFLLWFG